MLLHWVWKWIGLIKLNHWILKDGLSNIVALGPGERIVVAFGCPIIQEIFFCQLTTLVVADLLLRKLGEAVNKRPDSLQILNFSQTMFPLWIKLVYKVDDLVVSPPPPFQGGIVFGRLQCTRVLSLVLFFHSFLTGSGSSGYTQGYSIGKVGLLLFTRYYKGCRECSAPNLINHKEGGLNIGISGMRISSRLIWIGILTSTGNWVKLKGYLGMLIKTMCLGIKNLMMVWILWCHYLVLFITFTTYSTEYLKLHQGQGVFDAHQKVHIRLMLGEGTLQYQ